MDSREYAASAGRFWDEPSQKRTANMTSGMFEFAKRQIDIADIAD
jgi:hypothetical protein